VEGGPGRHEVRIVCSVEDMDQVRPIPGGGLLFGAQPGGLSLTETEPGARTAHGEELSRKPRALGSGAIEQRR
jgi:hypothetical protein